MNPATGEAALQAQTRLVHEWRRFPFLDPRLPAQLLPGNWSGAKAADLFHARHAEWHPAAQRHWEYLTGDKASTDHQDGPLPPGRRPPREGHCHRLTSPRTGTAPVPFTPD